jgi:tetratricopeptide (TPR) repeat protein
MDRFTRRRVLEILRISPGRLNYWEKLGLVQPEPGGTRAVYSLHDLISMRAILRLTSRGVPASRLKHQLAMMTAEEALRTKKPLVELRLEASVGAAVMQKIDGTLVELGTGQHLLHLDGLIQGDTEPETVRRLRHRTPEQWWAAARDAEGDMARWTEACQAYEYIVRVSPASLEAWMNLGTLRFKTGQVEDAENAYRQAVSLAPDHPAVRFNLANALEERGLVEEALEHLLEAVSLEPDYADAHFNLALLLDRLGRPQHARQHWLRYLQIDERGEWAHLARRHLTDVMPTQSPPDIPESPEKVAIDSATPSHMVQKPSSRVIPLRPV